MGVQPQAQRFGDDGFGSEATGLSFGEQQMQLIQWQGDRDAAHHFFFHPSRDGAFAALPFNNGLCGASAELGGELFASEASGFTEGFKLLRFHG